ncbi:hypothetical protein BH10BDE1_BH10BDE1_14920 [soil metagenome]
MSSHELARLKVWLTKKWETAEEWLPWFLGITSVSVLIVGIIVGFLRRDIRGPANFIEVSDSDTPASQIYADESVESLNGTVARKRVAKKSEDEQEERQRRAPSDERKEVAPRTLVVTLKERVSEAEIEARTGIQGVRSRAVAISTQALDRKTGVEIRLKIDLFTGISPIFQMKSQSAYEVNKGMLSGTAPDDPNSRAEITYDSGMISGFLIYMGKNYRIVADPERGVHYVVEVRQL